MVLSGEFLASFLRRILWIIIEDGAILNNNENRKKFGDLFSLSIKKKNDWTLPDFLIELEACMAFFNASNNQPGWMTEFQFGVIFDHLPARVDRRLGEEITKLHYDQDFVIRKASVVEQRRILGESMLGSKNIVT